MTKAEGIAPEDLEVRKDKKDGTHISADILKDYGISSAADTTLYDILVQTMASYDDSDGMMELESHISSFAQNNEDMLFLSSHHSTGNMSLK